MVEHAGAGVYARRSPWRLLVGGLALVALVAIWPGLEEFVVDVIRSPIGLLTVSVGLALAAVWTLVEGEAYQRAAGLLRRQALLSAGLANIASLAAGLAVPRAFDYALPRAQLAVYQLNAALGMALGLGISLGLLLAVELAVLYALNYRFANRRRLIGVATFVNLATWAASCVVSYGTGMLCSLLGLG